MRPDELPVPNCLVSIDSSQSIGSIRYEQASSQVGFTAFDNSEEREKITSFFSFNPNAIDKNLFHDGRFAVGSKFEWELYGDMILILQKENSKVIFTWQKRLAREQPKIPSRPALRLPSDSPMKQLNSFIEPWRLQKQSKPNEEEMQRNTVRLPGFSSLIQSPGELKKSGDLPQNVSRGVVIPKAARASTLSSLSCLFPSAQSLGAPAGQHSFNGSLPPPATQCHYNNQPMQSNLIKIHLTRFSELPLPDLKYSDNPPAEEVVAPFMQNEGSETEDEADNSENENSDGKKLDE